MSASSISERYFAELSTLKSGLSWWCKVLEPAARVIDPSAVVSGRVKSYRSTIGKIYRRAGAPRAWESLGDLIALKAIFPTERGVQEFTAWLSSQENWHPKLDEKASAPDQLRYQSKQFDLASDEVIDSMGAPIKVEVQARTAVADAWYVVDHRLRYKGTVDLPKTLERKLFRLIVLTELFDEEVEAVMASQAQLPEYGIARLYEQLTAEVDKLIDGYAKTSRPEGLLELVLTSYTEEEVSGLPAILERFVREQGEQVRAVIEDHLYKSKNFVEVRDWLYYEPEALLIAERSSQRPSMITASLRGSDFETIIGSMINEFSSRLPKT